jgi:hypothetical protein
MWVLNATFITSFHKEKFINLLYSFVTTFHLSLLSLFQALPFECLSMSSLLQNALPIDGVSMNWRPHYVAFLDNKNYRYLIAVIVMTKPRYFIRDKKCFPRAVNSIEWKKNIKNQKLFFVQFRRQSYPWTYSYGTSFTFE